VANETTSTSLNKFIYSAIISPLIMATIAEQALPLQWAREYNLVGQAANAVDVPYFNSILGTANDRGAGVDTEYDATEATALSNTQIGSSKYTLTASEYAVLTEITKNVSEDAISGIDIFGAIQGFLGRALALALSYDFAVLFASSSNSVGTTNTAPTLANILSGIAGIRTRGTLAPGGLGMLLDNQHAIYLESEIMGTAANQAAYLFAGDRMLGIAAGANNGLDPSKLVFSIRGYPAIVTGLTQTANVGVDAVSQILTPSGNGNDEYSTFGLVLKRLPIIELQPAIEKRTTKMVMSMRAGVGFLHNATGTKVVAKAT
jgi:hypothetical protein